MKNIAIELGLPKSDLPLILVGKHHSFRTLFLMNLVHGLNSSEEHSDELTLYINNEHSVEQLTSYLQQLGTTVVTTEDSKIGLVSTTLDVSYNTTLNLIKVVETVKPNLKTVIIDYNFTANTLHAAFIFSIAGVCKSKGMRLIVSVTSYPDKNTDNSLDQFYKIGEVLKIETTVENNVKAVIFTQGEVSHSVVLPSDSFSLSD